MLRPYAHPGSSRASKVEVSGSLKIRGEQRWDHGSPGSPLTQSCELVSPSCRSCRNEMEHIVAPDVSMMSLLFFTFFH